MLISGSLIEVGYSLRTHGVKGFLRIQFNENIRVLSKSEALFFLFSENHIPYFIEEIDYFENGDTLIKLEDINTKEDAAVLTKKPVFGNLEYVLPEEEEELDSEFVGFLIVDSDLGELGVILNVTSMGDYDLVTLNFNEKELLLALHPNLILKTDLKKQILFIQAPEGILDI
ncbi:MAG: hypothetical protein WAT52_09110 [Chitinophagales bacterium]